MSPLWKILIGTAALVLSPLILTIAAIAAVMFVLDAFLRRFLVDAPQLKQKQYNINNRHLTVFLPGTINFGETIVVKVLPFLMGKGDVIVVNYGAKRFVPKTISDLVIHAINEKIARDGRVEDHYNKVTLIGASRGGKLAHDIQIEASKRNPNQEIRAMLVDGLPSTSFLKDPMARIPGWRILPFGPIWNLVSRPIFKAIYIQPEWEKLEEGYDRKAIELNLDRQYSIEASVAHDQLEYYDPPQKDEARGLKAVYFESGRDIAVKHPESAAAFKKSYGDGMIVIKLPGVTHMGGFLEYPAQFLEALEEGFTYLG